MAIKPAKTPKSAPADTRPFPRYRYFEIYEQEGVRHHFPLFVETREDARSHIAGTLETLILDGELAVENGEDVVEIAVTSEDSTGRLFAIPVCCDVDVSVSVAQMWGDQ